MARITLELDVDARSWEADMTDGEQRAIARESLRAAARTATGLGSLWDRAFTVVPVGYTIDGERTTLDDPPF